MKAGDLIVTQHNPGWRLFKQLLLTVVLAAVGWGFYWGGQQKSGYDRTVHQQAQRGFRNAVTELERQNGLLRDQVALLQRSSEVDQQAYSEVGNNLKALQQEIVELREEVNFYRGIVSPRESSTGLRIERFELEKASGQRRLYHYQLVLTQVLKNDRSVRGSASFTIEGVQAGKPRTLRLKAVAVDKKTILNFKFRYFQKLEGDIALPEGFEAREVLVSVNPSKRKKIRRSYPWPGGDDEA